MCLVTILQLRVCVCVCVCVLCIFWSFVGLIFLLVNSLTNEIRVCGSNFIYCADAFSGNSPSWRPELAIVEYSPKPMDNSPESRAEGN